MRTFVVIMFGVTLMLSALANWSNTPSLANGAAPSVQTAVDGS